MAIIVYVILILTLLVMNGKYSTKHCLKHATYTKPIYFSVYALCSVVLKKTICGSGGRLFLLYGRNRGENLICMNWTVKISSAVMFAVFPVVYAAVVKAGIEETALTCLMPVLGFLLPDIDLKTKINKRKASILMDFPVFCTDLAIMVGSGLNIPEAWRKAANRKTRTEFYKEARFVVLKTETGVMFREALGEFSGRLALPEIFTFVSIINQSIKAGDENMTEMIRTCARRSWKIREDNARKKGEEASVKLVFPLVLGLMGIILILSAPAVILMKGI